MPNAAGPDALGDEHLGAEALAHVAAPGPLGVQRALPDVHGAGRDDRALGVVHHVAQLLAESDPSSQAREYARYLDEHFIQKGLLGVASGQGFYRYPNPAFEQPGFI